MASHHFLKQELKTCAGLLNHRDPKIRVSVARSVGGYRTRAQAFLSDLEAAARDDDPMVREAVAEAIRQVRGRESPSTN